MDKFIYSCISESSSTSQWNKRSQGNKHEDMLKYWFNIYGFTSVRVNNDEEPKPKPKRTAKMDKPDISLMLVLFKVLSVWSWIQGSTLCKEEHMTVIRGINTLGAMLSWENNPLHGGNNNFTTIACLWAVSHHSSMNYLSLTTRPALFYSLRIARSWMWWEMSCAVSSATEMHSPRHPEIGSETGGPEVSLNPNDPTVIHNQKPIEQNSPHFLAGRDLVSLPCQSQ